MTEIVGSHPQYDRFADQFLAHARDGFFNAHYDRPACLDLLGDVAGKRVFDAACGPGLYAEELVARGAEVSGVDISPRMIELAREREPAGEFRVHDLAEPLAWKTGASADLVLMALALEYVDDRVALLRELRRVLRPEGALVLSRMHPVGDWLRHGGSYFDERVVEEVWQGGWHVRFWLAPLSRTCEELHEAGFLIERLVEVRPAPETREADPEAYERISTEPTGFLAIRAIPDPRN